jgi:hypothetical protein
VIVHLGSGRTAARTLCTIRKRPVVSARTVSEYMEYARGVFPIVMRNLRRYEFNEYAKLRRDAEGISQR